MVNHQMASRRINEIIEPRMDLENIPLSALRPKTRSRLSILLNPEKVLANEDGYHRDWRGLFSLAGMSQSELSQVSHSDDKTASLFDIWIRNNAENDTSVSLSQLLQCFALIDRYDVIDDTQTMIFDDAKAFKERKPELALTPLPYEPENSNILTTLDSEYYRDGLPLPIYDALVIYDDEDDAFASELVTRLREKNYLLCLKDDLLPGLPFEYDSLITLLSKRCNRLIVIISRKFLQSKTQVSLTNYGQSLNIEQGGKRKIIPCVIERIDPSELPQMLRFCYRLDYFRDNKLLFDFWAKLEQSLQLNVENPMNTKSIEPSAPQQPDIVYKFTQPPATPEKIKRPSFSNETTQEEPKRQIMPPPRKLRQASSMIGLDSIPNGTMSHHSQSTLNLHEEEIDGTNEDEDVEAKLKRKKWYSMFLPPHKQKEKVKVEEIKNEQSSLKKEKKKRWFKSKKKSEKIAVQL